MAINFEKATNGMLLNDLIEKTNQQKNTIVTIDIDADLIDENPDNEKIFNMDKVDYLAKGMQDEGFYGAIEVYKKSDGRYEISSGHRRFRAARMNGYDRVPCIVLPDTDEKTKAIRLLSTNIRNRVLKPLDYARAIRYYKENIMEPGAGTTREKVAEFFDISEIQVYRYESLLNLVPELQQLVGEKEYAYSALSSAASLTEEEQRELYKKIFQMDNGDENQITNARINMFIKEIKQRKEPKRDSSGYLKDSSVEEDPVPLSNDMEQETVSNQSYMASTESTENILNPPEILDDTLQIQNVSLADGMIETELKSYAVRIERLVDNIRASNTFNDKKSIAASIKSISNSLNTLKNYIEE